jgi:ATP-dependent helicase IRC3
MLRPYQKEAIAKIREHYSAGKVRQILCMGTGTGKTEVFAHLPEEVKDILSGQQIVLLHRDELAQQAYRKITQRNPHLKIHIEAGTSYADPDADVIIASVQTLGRKNTERIKRFNFQNFDKWVVDEAHRSIAQSYMNVYEAANLLQDGDKRLLLGCTATPFRGDGQPLGTLYQTISYTYSLRQAIEDGWLVDIKGLRVNTDTSLDEVSTSGGDFNQEELADTVNTPARNQLVVDSYKKHCDGRQAIGFGVDIKHSQVLAECFVASGINAEAVWGTDPDRHDKIQKFRDGKIQVLFNAQLLVEGFDLDTISCVILAAPTKSGVVFSQRVGRGTRLSPLKKDCIVLDVVDATHRHNLVTLPTLLGMPRNLDLHGRSLVGSCKLIEEKQAEFANLDFTTLKDIDKINAFVEEVNLFEVKFLPEVEANSEFVWHPSIGGGYILMLPNKDFIRMSQNLLDKYELCASIKGKRYKGERDSMDAAFSAADDLVRKISPESLTLVVRDAYWRDEPATPKQMKTVRKFYKGKQIPNDLSKGKADSLIKAAIAKKGAK